MIPVKMNTQVICGNRLAENITTDGLKCMRAVTDLRPGGALIGTNSKGVTNGIDT